MSAAVEVDVLTTPSTLTLTNYHPNILCGPSVTVYLGDRVALVVDSKATFTTSEGTQSLPTFIAWARAQRLGVMTEVVDMLERMLALYDRVVGQAPPVNSTAVDGRLGGRVPVEVSLLGGAGGKCREPPPATPAFSQARCLAM